MPRPEPLVILAVVAGLLSAAPAGAAPSPHDKRLQELEDELKKGRAEQQELQIKARTLAQELSTLNEDMVKAASLAQEHEEGLSALEARLAELRAREKEDAEALERRQKQTIGVLTAVQRLAWRPTEALVAQPTSPADTVRSAILLRAALPRIEEDAMLLRLELDELAALRGEIAAKRQEAVVVAGKLTAEQRRLQGMVRRKQGLQAATEEKNRQTEQRLAGLAAEAADLRELIQRLQEDKDLRRGEDRRERLAVERRPKPEPEPAVAQAEVPAATEPQQVSLVVPPPEPPAFSELEGHLPYPARGRVVAQFGQNTDVGTTHRGITIETRAGAQVIAPHDGQVAFAGPFRGYGLLLIIEHGEGYHTLLAGMTRIDSLVGQRLLAGEPVGVMERSTAGTKPALYFELRRNGQPVNPLPWLTARKDKVSG